MKTTQEVRNEFEQILSEVKNINGVTPELGCFYEVQQNRVLSDLIDKDLIIYYVFDLR